MKERTWSLCFRILLVAALYVVAGCDTAGPDEELSAEIPVSADSSISNPAAEAMFNQLKTATPSTGTGLASVYPWADAYVWHWNPSAGSYTADGPYSYNRGGGPIEIYRYGPGSYSVRFTGLGSVVSLKTTSQVTGYDANINICNALSAGGSEYVEVRCWNAHTGTMVDAQFTVVAHDQRSDIAFAHVTSGYTAYPWFTHNPSGGVVGVTRLATGRYKVRFNGLSGPWVSNTNVQVKAITGNPDNCKVENTAGPTLEVTVRCYNRSGTAVDRPFNVLVIRQHEHAAFAQVNQPATGAPTLTRTYNPSAQGITVSRFATGRYEVNFKGIVPFLHNGGNVQVTPRGAGNKQCKVEGWWSPFGNNDIAVYVRCFAPGGYLSNAPFHVTLTS